MDLTTEQVYWKRGFLAVVGVDEVGRGCLAGPVVAAAVSFPTDHQMIPDINDSKQLTPQKRTALDLAIRKTATHIGIGKVSAKMIDRMGIVEATSLAMKRACMQVDHEVILVDGPRLLDLDQLCDQVEAVVKGDQKIYSIAAASIVAKVYRDRLMTELAKKYPLYRWDLNKGYGTKVHVEAIRKLGLTMVHRKSFTLRHPSKDIASKR